MRKNPTEAEKAMWKILKNGDLAKLTFNRQKILGNYIADFYCSKAKLVIEVDGESHAENDQKEYDEVRTAFLNGFNLKVLRFWNNDVIENPEGAHETILQAIQKSPIPFFLKRGKIRNEQLNIPPCKRGLGGSNPNQ